MVFADYKLILRSYTSYKTLLMIYKVKIICKIEFVKVALPENVKAFIVYIVFFCLKLINLA